MLVCSLMIEDLPEGNLQGVCPPDTARIGVVRGDAQGMVVDVTHHHHRPVETRTTGITHPGDTRRQGGDIHQIEEEIPQIEGETLLKGEEILPIGEVTLLIGEDTLQGEADPQLEGAPHQGTTPLQETHHLHHHLHGVIH